MELLINNFVMQTKDLIQSSPYNLLLQEAIYAVKEIIKKPIFYNIHNLLNICI